ncbi:MAG TPA: hypothetical protein VD767_00090 [Thermomicrobiales bacterium]|nr:hypothetical protein [Thermomicrobiales bacterium]
MPFPQKSAMVMAGILVVVYGAYFAWMGWWQATTPVEDIPFQPLMILIVIPLVILAVAGQVILALFAPGDANAWDERDREIERRAGQPAGYILAVTVFGGIVLAMFEADPFYIANGLMLGWVTAQVIEYLLAVELYRRGVGA